MYQSAPSSSSSSPIRSPQMMLNGDPYILHPHSTRQSEPIFPTGFPYAGPLESTMVSHDSSPYRSPLPKSPKPPHKSTSGPPSSMRPRLSVEISPPRHDCNVLVNVYPLPLPPTPSSSVPASPVPQVTTRPEFLPMKTQWTKGKLIGRGTFGSVYAATNRYVVVSYWSNCCYHAFASVSLVAIIYLPLIIQRNRSFVCHERSRLVS